MLQWCAGFIVAALGLDLLQYVIGAFRVGRVAKRAETAGKTEDDAVLYPKGHPRIMNGIWWLKVALVIVAWGLLLWHVGSLAVNGTLPAISD